MELYIVRHGETDWNKLKRFQGNIDIELNEKGRELAGLLGARLEKENITFERIYSSPLNRAYETACLIRGHQNVKILIIIFKLRLDKLDKLGYNLVTWLRHQGTYLAISIKFPFYTIKAPRSPPRCFNFIIKQRSW